jgi:transcriptional regulator with XRE-family HTH domain
MVEKRTTAAEPYAYVLSGLKDVGLVNIAVYRCPQCSYAAPIIPRVGELHRLIALALVTQGSPLRGDQVRFLRKHAGLPARQFANLLGVTPQHLSRVENGHRPFGAPTDRLIRAITLTATDCKEARRKLLQIAGRLEKGARREQPRPLFRLRGGRWLKAA